MKLGVLIVAAVGVVAVAVGLYFTFDQEGVENSATQPATAVDGGTDVSGAQQAQSPAPQAAEEPASVGGESVPDETTPKETAPGETAQEGTTEQDPAPLGTASQNAAADSGEAAGEDSAVTAADDSSIAATAPATESVTAPKPQASFDLVRVEKSGEAVIAGRAPVGSQVTVFDGGRNIGSVVVGPSGGWVLLPGDPLSPGSHQLSIRAVMADGGEVWSENMAVVEVPEPEVQVAVVPEPEPVPDEEEGTQTTQTGASQAAATDQTSADADIVTSDSGAIDTATAGTVSTDLGVVDAATTGSGTPVPESVEAEPLALANAGTTAIKEAEAPEADGAEQEGALVVLVPNDPGQPSEVLQVPETTADEGIRQDSLSLETVDYDEAGMAVISGRATPGASILIYLDNLAVADVVADSSGRWAVRPEASIIPGLHRLRVDQLGPDGAVSARVETPFSRAEVAEIQVAENRVVVQPGNSLWRIARRVYGRGMRYTVIYQANDDQIGDPDLIYPGQIFSLPSTD